jgi:hypothetical protein
VKDIEKTKILLFLLSLKGRFLSSDEGVLRNQLRFGR